MLPISQSVCPFQYSPAQSKAIPKFRCSLYSRLLALPATVSLRCKGLPRTNTLAYQECLSITLVNRFITLTPGYKKIQKFTPIFFLCHRPKHIQTIGFQTTLAKEQGIILKRLNFLSYLPMGPVSWSVIFHQV